MTQGRALGIGLGLGLVLAAYGWWFNEARLTVASPWTWGFYVAQVGTAIAVAVTASGSRVRRALRGTTTAIGGAGIYAVFVWWLHAGDPWFLDQLRRDRLDAAVAAGQSDSEVASLRARLDARLTPGLFALGALVSLGTAGATGAAAASLWHSSSRPRTDLVL